MTKALMIKLITSYSLSQGLDPNVALSVAKIESNFNPNVISSTGDFGVFQLHRNTFPEYSEYELLNYNINIKLGINYLVKMKKQCKYQLNNQWLICYNAGLNNKIKFPELYPYVVKTQLAMMESK